MPICEADPWRMQYFEGISCPPAVRIPTEDGDAWSWHPQHKWIYNKLMMVGYIAGPESVIKLWGDSLCTTKRPRM